jgi:hypothetical protein
MNKHIELVKKWLDKPESVSLEELEANREAASDAYWATAKATIYGSDWPVEAVVYWAAKAAKATAKAAKATAKAAAEAAYKAAAEAAYWATFEAAKAAYWRNQAITYIKQYEELTKWNYIIEGKDDE